MIHAYKQFLNKKKAIKPCGPLAPYHWYKLQKPIPGQWMAYSLMLDEHSMELANSINELQRYITTLAAWKEVIDNKSDSEKFEIVIEFIDPITTLAINLPYVIRSRFINSVAHLCHQANQVNQKNWVDDLPIDNEIYFDVADKYASLWKSYKKLKFALEKISNKQYQSDTYDFRNKYNHRYSPKIEIGVTGLVRRNVRANGQVSYGLGYTKPIKIDQLLPVLSAQYLACLKAFEEYQKLVQEHISEIR